HSVSWYFWYSGVARHQRQRCTPSGPGRVAVLVMMPPTLPFWGVTGQFVLAATTAAAAGATAVLSRASARNRLYLNWCELFRKEAGMRVRLCILLLAVFLGPCNIAFASGPAETFGGSGIY